MIGNGDECVGAAIAPVYLRRRDGAREEGLVEILFHRRRVLVLPEFAAFVDRSPASRE
jgi:hypothetical protein